MDHRTIVVTGASKGLGRVLVDGFAKLGHRVVGCARNAEAMQELRAAYPDSNFQALDVTDAEQVQNWAEQVVSEIGVPDLIVNNAALINENRCLWEVSVKEFSNVVDVNIKGVFHVIKAFLPRMIENGTGVIANFSSGWGRATSPEVAPYCATKWAIEGLSQALAQELPRGLASVPVNPGIINTDMLQSCFGSAASSYPSPGDWAQRAVPFLLKLGPQDNGRPVSI